MTPLDSVIIAIVALAILIIMYVAQYVIKVTFKISKIMLLGISTVFFAFAIFTLAMNLHHNGGKNLEKSHIVNFIKSGPVHKILKFGEYYVFNTVKEWFSWFMGYVNEFAETDINNSTMSQ